MLNSVDVEPGVEVAGRSIVEELEESDENASAVGEGVEALDGSGPVDVHASDGKKAEAMTSSV